MVRMKLSVVFGYLFLFTSVALAQNAGKITGSITSENKKAFEAATVSLLQAKDSATIKLAVSDKQGNFIFENLPSGKYLVSVTAVGFEKVFTGVVDISSGGIIQLPAIHLLPQAKGLAGVTVTASRPLIEQKIDRTIVNVDAFISNNGLSALEVLEKSPGITIDQEGNISLKGKEGVLVMIDGRPTQLGGTDLANLLRNMNSSQMDEVEIMTNPPARYDASGNSGIINIKTKKIITAGYNGSANIGFSQGRYPKTNEGVNFNYRKDKVNIFTNLSHNFQKEFGNIRINRNIFDANTNAVEKIFNQDADRIFEGHSYSGKLGLDFFATKKTTIGFVLNGNSRKASSDNSNITNISNSSKVLESVTKAVVDNESDWKSFSTNLNFRHVFDKKGKEITSDIDFLNYRFGNELFMENSYTDADGNPYMNADSLTGYLPQHIRVYSGRVDLVLPLKKEAKFEAGIKSGMVTTDNNAIYDSIQNGVTVRDLNRSNHFVYDENINAAYVNFSTPLSKKISAQLGLRLENTNAKGRQKTTGENFDRHYTQLFPTAYFQYKADEKNNFGLNFGRRVRRPDYQDLNPFIRFIDRYTYSQGNPNLQPSFSNSIELSHNWKNQLITTLNYSSTKDIIDDVVEQKGQEAYSIPSNIASLTQFGLSINANTPVNKWWRSSMNFMVFHNRYEGIASQVPIDFATTSFVITGTQQFKINKTLTAELNGRFRTGWLEGVMRAKPVGFIGAGFSQQVMKNKGTIRVNVRDIFRTQVFRGRSAYGNVDFEIEQMRDSRVVSVGFSYRFSKGKKIAPVRRSEGSANEEQERIGD